MRSRPLTLDDLRGHAGLRGDALLSLLAAQPTTVLEALRIRDVGRKTTARLLAAGLISDPDGVQWQAERPSQGEPQ